MSLLKSLGGPAVGPTALSGREVLVGPDPDVCKIAGVMFAARREFLNNEMGELTFYSVLGKLTGKTMQQAMHPVASAWYDFATIVEYDHAIYDTCRDRYPHVLDLVGAASAELGITRVFAKLDETELYAFLEKLARFHERYQKYGRLELERTVNGARMHYHDYPCYSPVFCASGHGFLLESVLRHGAKDATVIESRCHCRGDDVCTYELTWR